MGSVHSESLNDFWGYSEWWDQNHVIFCWRSEHGKWWYKYKIWVICLSVIEYGCSKDLKTWSSLASCNIALASTPLFFWLSNFHAVYQNLSHITHTEIKVSFAHCTMGNFANSIKKITNILNQYLISTVCNTGSTWHLLVKNKLLNTKWFIALLFSSSSFCLLVS